MLERGKMDHNVIEMVGIDSLVPEEHLLRKIDKAVDFNRIYEMVEPLYCEDNGRPSVDPVVLFKMVLIQHLYGLPSLRRTAEEVSGSIYYRWFLGYTLQEETPHFSTVSCAPFCPAPRPAEIAVLEEEEKAHDAAEPADEQPVMSYGQPDADEDASARPAEIAVLDMPNPQVLTCQNGSSRSAETAVLDLPKPHTSKKEKRKKEKSDTERITTVERVRERAELDHLIRRCEFDLFEPEEQTVLRDAITWLYYCGELTIGQCAYPQLQVRETLWRLNWEVLDCALAKLRENEKAEMRNTLVYTAKVVYSTILERGCDTMPDPVVNQCRDGAKTRLG